MKAFISDSVTGIVGNVTETKLDPETGYMIATIDGQPFYYNYILFL